MGGYNIPMTMHQPPLEHINEHAVLRHLGAHREPPSGDLLAEIRQAAAQILAVASPQAVYRIFPRTALASVLLGEDIHAHLGSSTEVLLLACTLGQTVDYRIRQAQAVAMHEAVVLDAVASTAIEDYATTWEASLRQQTLASGRYLTTRFSPGYGDLPLAVQTQILQLTDAQRSIGLTLNAQDLMLPLKSITCLMGLSHEPISEAADPCAICQRRDACALRQRGGYCGRFQS